MANQTVSINNLSDSIMTELKKYGASLATDTKQIIDSATNEFVNDTKRDAPKGSRNKYNKNISSKTLSESPNGKVNIWYVKDPEYRLTHLLVNGHATRNGGRTKAQDFLSPNVDILEKNVEKGIGKVIENGR